MSVVVARSRHAMLHGKLRTGVRAYVASRRARVMRTALARTAGAVHFRLLYGYARQNAQRR